MPISRPKLLAITLTAVPLVAACSPRPKVWQRSGSAPAVSDEQHFAASMQGRLQAAQALRHQHEFEQAAEMAERVLHSQEQAYGQDDPRLIPALNELIASSCAGAKCPSLGPFYRHLLRIREKTLGPDHPDVATTLALLGEVEQMHGRYADAEQLYERALAIRRRAFGEQSVLAAATLEQLGRCYLLDRKYPQAADSLQRAIVIQERSPVQGSKMLASLRQEYAAAVHHK